MHSFSCSYVEFLQLYKAFTQSVQSKCIKCTRVYKSVYLKGFEMILKNLLIYFFQSWGTFLTHFAWPQIHCMHVIWCTPCLFILLDHSLIMNMNRNYDKLFPHFPWPMRMETLFAHHMHSFNCTYVEFLPLYKTFTLTV